ncbi:GNAT family N-acetyltransferase [Clostridium tagluense]|uniref:GNAT family N-acetyltransferase n=1 Tax=Clostridium tagluense TaxID=360422 RepID=UPI001CF190AE|nr:GNAT family N-acetyltransferase [Clostridium tagluense]MCB2310028.1 GNAT family N-acetyltransferase [Clostridium tagluense]MCB2314442.1 GNAT family N-acetyltransferase [Clostridium tagluense]MCB2319288.1 GNAT family N-acetyltransferase [Clostridium tagluense]MCB2324622.1 GNAT family N-acetyltransferase [Clostridium tagluense]MCB2329473.1 GNAT family N-acetyltransferase [Clostridium tagluense]
MIKIKCSFYDFSDNEKLNEFLTKNAINQQNYLIKDIYKYKQLFEYKYIICEEQGEILGVMPFVLYRNDLGNIIHSMPFLGYGGIASSCLDSACTDVFKFIIDFFMSFAKNENVLLATICTTPFSDDYNIYKKVLKPEIEKENFYQYLNLEEDIFGNMSSKFRGNLRRNKKKCESFGVSISESYSLDDLKYWYNNVYKKRLLETNCAIYPYEVFEVFATKFNKDKFKIVYAKIEEKIIGGGMFLNQGSSIDNFMRVIDSDYFYTQAGSCIDLWSVEYALNSGAKYYNWQSCDKIGSPIFKNKAYWGSKTDNHYYLTKIIGDLSEFVKIPLEVIKKEYAGIYVMPYEKFING